MKKILLSSVIVCLSNMSYGLQVMDDESLGETTGQTGVDLKVAVTANVENLYFQTDNNRMNMGNISIDTDSRNGGLSNQPFRISVDAINSGFRQGLEMIISDVNAVDFTVNDLSLSKSDNSNKTVFGAIGIENINFNGGQAMLSLTSRAGMGNQGLETGFSLPDGTTFEFTINDLEVITDGFGARQVGGELRADIEINDFSIVQTLDVIQLGNDDQGVDQGVGLQIMISEFETSLDVRNLTAGDGTSHLGSYGRVVIDGLHLKRGYLIVDAL